MELCESLKKIIDESGITDKDGNLLSCQSKQLNNFFEKLNDRWVNLENKVKLKTDEYEWLKIILDATPCTISWIGRDLKYIGVNRALADTCKLPLDDFSNRTIGFHTDNNELYDFSVELFQTENKTSYKELESEINGEIRKFWISGTRFDNDSQAILIGVEVTELKNLEAHVIFTEKLTSLGEMVAGIMHEINNPLGMIDLNLRKLSKLSDDQKVIKTVSDIKKITEKIGKIIRGVKNFVRRGENDPDIIESLDSIIEEALVICEGKMKEFGITFELNRNDLDLKIDCNVTQIFQIFVNLMANSADAIQNKKEKWIRVSFHKHNEYGIVWFEDSGEGIPDKIINELFKPFFTTKDVGVGTGLGLSLCDKIMKIHGGSISVDREAPNTRFVLKFPNRRSEDH